MVRKDKSQSLNHFSTIFFFVAIAALLWLIIKLSAVYSVTEDLTINLKDSPADLIIIDDSQKFKVNLSTSGFELLHYYFKPSSKRKVDISLKEVPLHKDSESTYSFSSAYAKEKVASWLSVETNKVSFDDNRISVRMEQLDSAFVKVQPKVEISFEKQYNRHSKIKITPDSLMIYGPKNRLATVDNVSTEAVSLKNVNSNVDIDVPIVLEDMIFANQKDVNIKIDVEKYTEAIANVKIKNDSDKKLRLFPDRVKIRYIVSLTDYNIINENSFDIRIDSSDISKTNSLLPVYLIDYPNNTNIISIEPKEVEYIILEDNEN